MDKKKQPVSLSKKLSAILVAALLVCNFLLLFPAYVTSSPQQNMTTSFSRDSSDFCIPIPIIFPCKSPTSRVTPTATRGTPGVTPTKSATATPTRLPQFAVNGAFTLTATLIVAHNAHLDTSDFLHPVLSFSSTTIQGLKITSLAITLSASGVVTGSGVAIKTSVFRDLVTALSSFTNKADLLLLLAGVTVKTLTMKNVRLDVDRYIHMQSNTVKIGRAHV